MVMSLNTADWDRYKDEINNAHNSFNQVIMTWRRTVNRLDRFQEDTQVTTDIELEVLLQGNHFRSWPINDTSDAGEVNKESLVIFLNIEYLNGEGHLTADGYFDFDAGLDFFIFKGLIYKPFGNTEVSYALDNPLLLQIVLEPVQTETGDRVNNPAT